MSIGGLPDDHPVIQARVDAVRSELWDRPEAADAHAANAPRRTMTRGWLMRRALLLADLIGLSVGFFAAELINGRGPDVPGLGPGEEYLVFLVSLPCWVVVASAICSAVLSFGFIDPLLSP